MSEHLTRGVLLLQQDKLDLAEQSLRQACVVDPDWGVAHAFLALCLAEQERYAEATEEAQTAIRLEPDRAFSHAALAQVMLDRNRFKEARQAITEAVRLDPRNAGNWGKLAITELTLENWKGALEAAEQGLALDPEEPMCQNTRSIALMKLGRAKEVVADVSGTLAQNPDDSMAHANQGWALLETGDNRKALEHFGEALRLDPESEWARAGLVTALKARNPIYRMMLNYFLWMGKLSAGFRWGLIIGLYVAYRSLRAVGQAHPQWQPYVTPLLIGYFVFVALTWLTDPLFNLLLRLDRFGKHALSDDQRRGANLTGICLLAALVGIPAAFLFDNGGPLAAGICALVLLIPCSTIYRCDVGWPRWTMGAFTAALAVLAVGTSVAVGVGNEALTEKFLSPFVLGAVASFWIGNLLPGVTIRA